MNPGRIIVMLACGVLLSAAIIAAQTSPSTPPPSEESTASAVASPNQAGEEVTPPKPIYQAAPKYPLEAKMKHLEGTVRLKIMVDHKGKVIILKVLSGHPLLAKAASKAVRRWRYTPSPLKGKPVAGPFEVTINFVLD